MQRVLSFEEGWAFIQQHGIDKLCRVLSRRQGEDDEDIIFKTAEFSRLYTMVYDMCAQSGKHNHSSKLYEAYGQVFSSYLREEVMPSLQTTDDAEMTLRVARAWRLHALMTRWMRNFFQYLDKHFVVRFHKPPLNAVAKENFRAHVFLNIASQCVQLLLRLLQQARAAEYEAVAKEDELPGKSATLIGALASDVRCITHMFLAMDEQIYVSKLEKPLLDATEGEMRRHANSLLLACVGSLAEETALKEAVPVESETPFEVYTNGVPRYIRAVQKLLSAELERAKDVFHSRSIALLRGVLFGTLVKEQEATLLCDAKSGFIAALRRFEVAEGAEAEEVKSDLRRTHRLFALTDEPDAMRSVGTVMRRHVVTVLTEMIKSHVSHAFSLSSKAAKDLAKEARLPSSGHWLSARIIDGVLEKRRKYEALMASHLEYNGVLHTAITAAFKQVLNQSDDLCRPNVQTNDQRKAEIPSSISEILALRFDAWLCQETDVETMRQGASLFNLLLDKDVFAEYYRRLLARRLLFNRSNSDEAERAVLALLKLHSGSQITGRAEGMLADAAHAEQIQTAFMQWLHSHPEKRTVQIDVSVRVLTEAYWPSESALGSALPDTRVLPVPSEIEAVQRAFRQFYEMRSPNRKLNWAHSLGRVTMRATFFHSDAANSVGKRYLLQMSTAQAVLLRTLARQGVMTVRDLRVACGFTDADLKRHLRPLVMAVRLVQKQPAQGFADTHRLRVNPTFSDPRRMIRIPVVPVGASASRADTSDALSVSRDMSSQRVVLQQRKLAIDAAIVRIMKTRRRLDHTRLMSAVISQLLTTAHFQAQPRDIKMRISDLIEREFLRRVEDSRDKYEYVA